MRNSATLKVLQMDCKTDQPIEFISGIVPSRQKTTSLKMGSVRHGTAFSTRIFQENTACYKQARRTTNRITRNRRDPNYIRVVPSLANYQYNRDCFKCQRSMEIVVTDVIGPLSGIRVSPVSPLQLGNLGSCNQTYMKQRVSG